jgi:hypothetical protein
MLELFVCVGSLGGFGSDGEFIVTGGGWALSCWSWGNLKFTVLRCYVVISVARYLGNL